ncbi:MAG: peptidylprolyl isomerase [Gammaproteobacteria bacterium]
MIKKNTVVSFKFKVTDTTGKLLEESIQPAVYLHGGYGNVPKYLEEQLEGHNVGEHLKVRVEPHQGFGERDETLVRHERRDTLPAGQLHVGMQIEAQREDTNDSMTFTVTEIDELGVTLDANHPFAGKTLIFDIEITDVRAARAEETTHGHAHGPGGHHH